ncbi:aminodeoxychorismate lyase [Teredinibacter turnerae]|uniref:aminodeoxychorismate lyase n=1 Tax=Teredinibacter turnerae TaxID=2426 RepID=UPI0005F796B0|nr:aminodeoxychorismate lyase [Teredinibacter turnerae]
MAGSGDALVLLNGCSIADLSADSLLLNRGFHYADGVFETLRVESGRLPLFDFHLVRLRRGCEHLGLVLADVFAEQLSAFTQAVRQRGESGVAKLTVYRAAAARGNYSGLNSTAELLFQFTPSSVVIDGQWVAPPVRLKTVSYRLYPNPQLAGIKHLNRLDYALATKNFSAELNCEALLLDPEDCVVETPHHNIFCLRGHRLMTPHLDKSGVAGVMRELILGLGKKIDGVDIQVCSLPFEQLLASDAVFLCNALRGIVPVAGCDRVAFGDSSTELAGRVAFAVKNYLDVDR